jgi:two-component system LytT family sensor kinase
MDIRTTKTTISPLQISEDISKPHLTKKGVTIVMASWGMYTLITAIPALNTFHIPFLTALLGQTLQSILKLILSIPIWFIVIRWMHKKKWYWKGLAHLFLGPIYTVLNYVYQYYSVVWFGSRVHEGSVIAPNWIIFFNLFIYIMQFVLYHSFEILRELRLKEKFTLELLALQKEQELAILKSQINPHFLFNTLNSISAMASTNAEETRTMIAQLGDLFRYVLDSSKTDWVPIKKELQFIKDYLDLESKRMGERLTIEFQVDQSLAAFSIPPMILQPLVENAIKHGIAPLEEGGKVTVEIQRNKETVVFRVSDTGVGLKSADPLLTMSGIGLKNIDARLRKIYGDSSMLKIRSLKDSGCEVFFSLPLI